MGSSNKLRSLALEYMCKNPPRFFKRRTAQEKIVDQTENCRVEPDPERQRAAQTAGAAFEYWNLVFPRCLEVGASGFHTTQLSRDPVEPLIDTQSGNRINLQRASRREI